VTFVSHSYLLFLWCAIAAKGFLAMIGSREA
jgi:hypothetical protein